MFDKTGLEKRDIRIFYGKACCIIMAAEVLKKIGIIFKNSKKREFGDGS